MLSGCEDREPVDDYHVTGGQSEELYLRLNIIQDKNPTRTEGDITYAGTEAESNISNMHVYLAKQDFSGISKLTEFTKLYQTPTGYTSELVKVNSGDYWLYLVANAIHSDDTRFVPSTSSVDLFMGKHTIDGNEHMDKFVTSDFFLMSNQQNYAIEADEYIKGGVPVSINDINTIDNPAVVSVKLDRLSSKIVPAVADECESAINGAELLSDEDKYYIDNINIEGVALLNCVKQFNLIQQWYKGSIYTWAPHDMKLFSPSGIADYPLDAYYNQLSEYVDKTTMTVNPSAVFFEPGTPLFCLENNSFNYKSVYIDTKYKGRATAVLFKVKARTYQKTDDGTEPSELPGHTFYRYNTLCFAMLDDLKANNPELSDLHTITELRQAGVQVYEEGYMYYIHWIKDTNYTNGGENYYAVMRNTWYDLTVTRISGFGDDIPGGGYEPGEPIDLDKTDIVIYPVCEKWAFYEVTHSFE